MNAILDTPLSLRLAALFVLGTIVAGFVNWGVYRLAWRQRSISPWSDPPHGHVRQWFDCLPLLGWWRLRREEGVHGTGHWIRPLAVELLTGALFAALYYWELEGAQELWWVGNAPAAPAAFLNADLLMAAHARYLAHVLLVSLMLVASLIDIDEKTIPDAITVPGTLLGLALAAVYPWSLPEAGYFLVDGAALVEFLTLVSPEPWPTQLGGWPLVEPLTIALGCWTLWCGGLLPRRWNTRHGWRNACGVFVRCLRRETKTYQILALWLVGGVAILLAAGQFSAPRWAGLLTALVGMAAGGGIVWLVRNIGSAVLQREAMGFGDVTLMSMIGAFLGWQPALFVFFLAPFAGLVMGGLVLFLRDEREIYFGPFLCLAALGVMVDWGGLWDWGSGIFALGWLVPVVLSGALGMLGLFLLVYRLIVQSFLRRR